MNSVPLMSRVTVLSNQTGREILLIERQLLGGGEYFDSSCTVLQPNSITEIQGTIYEQRHRRTNAPRKIIARRNDDINDPEVVFCAADFRVNANVIFYEEEGVLKIQKIPSSRGIMASFFRMKFMRYFRRPSEPEVVAANHPTVHVQRIGSSDALLPS